MNLQPLDRMKLAPLLSLLLSGPLLWGCTLLTPLPDQASLEARLRAFPTGNLPLKAPVAIYWNEHQMPFIEAQHDEDLAVALGMVHAHLRLAQMTVMRRIAAGRIAESAGPLAVDIDHALRILNFGRGVASFEAAMPAETRAFVAGFVRGINRYQDRLREQDLPHEFAVLALKREPWSVRDVLTVGRLAGTDINWLVYFTLLKLRDRPDWPEIWARVLRTGGDSAASFAPGDHAAPLKHLLVGHSRAGSNSVAIAGFRSESGAALIASDPHLGIQMPNLWLVVGFKSPSHHAAGLMIPGIPFIAVGRNPTVGWGGTNMRAASSDLFDVSKLPPGAITARRERIKVRWWFDKTIAVRETAHGPVISDAPPLDWRGKPFALRWVGHEHGDEVTAMLRAQRATNWSEFRAAFEGFAVSAQNMHYADKAGNIGQVMATMLPVRRQMLPPDMILDPADSATQWQRIATASQLPAAYNPKSGVLASANNRPTDTPFPVGYVFSADDRVLRLKELAGAAGKVGIADLKRLQLDVLVRSSAALRDAYLGAMRRLGVGEGGDAKTRRVIVLMAQWDGHYRAEAEEPVAFELFHHHFQQAYYTRRYGAEAAAAMFSIAAMPRVLLHDIPATPDHDLRRDLAKALADAAAQIGRFANWGEMHRLSLSHALAMAPLIGDRYRFDDLPASGSTESLMKTAHNSTDRRHFTRYGQQARFVADLSDPDRSYVALLGGQDGWINSSTSLDQVELWRKGAYIELPLRPETVRARFVYRMELKP